MRRFEIEYFGPLVGDDPAFDATDYATRIAGEVRGIDFTQYVEAKEVKEAIEGPSDATGGLEL